MTFFSILSILLLVAIGIVMAIAVIVLLFQAGRGIGFIFEHVFEVRPDECALLCLGIEAQHPRCAVWHIVQGVVFSENTV